MDIANLLSHFAVALGIGLLFGIERGWKTREDAAGSRTAGIRTFTIIGLLGGTVGVIAESAGTPLTVAGGIVLGLGFAGFAITFGMMCRDENLADKDYSATTAIAGMLAFALSAYAMVGNFRAAAAAAVAAAGLLALRNDIHGFVKVITWPELRSALILLAMTFIVLPVVPDDPIGPFGGVNPREVWLMAIILAGVAFIGYAAVKYFGARHGVLIAAAAGGLASSTAVTATNARRAAAGEGSPLLLAAGVALATAVSFVRVIAIAAVLNAALLPYVAPPLIAATIIAVGFALVATYWWEGRDKKAPVLKVKNPFGFWSVVGFAIVLVAIILVGRVLSETLGTAGAIVGAVVLGLGDVNAVTISMARLAPQPLSVQVASIAILVAVVSNTISKLLIGAVAGRGWFAIHLGLVSAACLAAGAITLGAALMYFGA